MHRIEGGELLKGIEASWEIRVLPVLTEVVLGWGDTWIGGEGVC